VAGGDDDPGDRAEQDGEESAGFDECIAEQQLAGSEEIRQDRVFERAKEGGEDQMPRQASTSR